MSRREIVALAGPVCILSLVLVNFVVAQTGSSKSKTKSKGATGTGVRALDARVQELQEGLLRDATDISKGYEDAGEYDRAKFLLEVLHKLDPKLPGLKDKIDKLTEKSLDSSEFEIDMDVSRGWTPAVAMLQKDRLVRIEATGDYKFVATLPVTADGLATSDNGVDVYPGAPVGALIGIIVNAETNKPGKPFEVRAKKDWTPPQAGYLQLKVNVPAGHKCTGKLKIKISGASKVAGT
ncbi:MAG: hypothetical protein Q8K78_04315 [Planctomycetaceae bacterium]|nr:hypothetical protein [Planctomycetaceae bacterium]